MRTAVEVPDFPSIVSNRKRHELARHGLTSRTELMKGLDAQAEFWGEGQPLRGYARLSTILDERLAAEVRQQRADGLSWAEIGEAIGISKQAAQQRFR